MQQTVKPANAIHGLVALPGDKSISHRFGMIGAIAEGTTTISNYSTGADCQSTLGCMAALGASVSRDESGRVVIQGGTLKAPSAQLDAGNSGTTIRMLTGILAGQPFESSIAGDESLARRPMARIIKPLTEMGASIEALEQRNEGGEDVADLRVRAGALKGVDVPADRAPSMIDEYPVLAIAASFAEGVTRMRGLKELRVKESDRLEATAAMLRNNGIEVEIEGDDLIVHGKGRAPGGGSTETALRSPEEFSALQRNARGSFHRDNRPCAAAFR